MFLALNDDDDGDDRSPWGEFWFNPVPYRAGGNVTPDTAMQLTAVHACVRVLAEGRAALPFRLYRVGADNRREYVEDHYLYRLFAMQPNAAQNAFEWAEMMQGHATLRGYAYSELVGESDGTVSAMLPLNPDTVSIELRKGAFDWRYKVANGDGTFRYLARTDVFHLRGLSFDGVQGISPIMAAKQALGLALAAESYGARFFENDAQPGGWIEYPGQFKDQNAKKEFRDSWRRSQSGRNRGKTAVLEFGMKYHELAVNNEEAQFLETRKMQIAEIARLFRVPPHMIGDLDRATNNNIEQQSLDFILYSLSPWIARWKAAIRSTFLVGTPDEDLQIDFPVTALLRGDLAARSTFYQSGITNGWLTRNEARLDDDRDPIDGLDEPLVPLNMATPEQAAEQLKQQSKPTAPKQPVDTPKGDDARAIALAQAAAERIARKESRMVQAEYAAMRKDGVDMQSVGDRFKRMSVLYQTHVQFVSDALDVLPEAARLYCEQQALSASFDMQIVDFECLTRSRCERLALKGTL